MENIQFAISVLWCIFGYALYYFLSVRFSPSGKHWNFLTGSDPLVKNVVVSRIRGFFLFGFIPFLIMIAYRKMPAEFGLGFSFSSYPPWYTVLLFPLIAVLSYYQARSVSHQAQYPQIRRKRWNRRILLLNAGSWIIFLTGYEILFRGLLLFSSIQVMETWLAITINCILYALAHFHKKPIEIAGVIPVGAVLCYLTVYTGNIWSAVILHSVMALSNEWFSLRAHPEIMIEQP